MQKNDLRNSIKVEDDTGAKFITGRDNPSANNARIA